MSSDMLCTRYNDGMNFAWRHIVMKLRHPVYYCFVNNILKQEGDILHICDDIISVEINCFRCINKGFLVAYFYFICITTHAWREWVPLLVCKFDIIETCFSLFLIPLSISNCIYTSLDNCTLFLTATNPSMNGIFCPSVCLSHLFDYVPIVVSSWNFQELLRMTKMTSM